MSRADLAPTERTPLSAGVYAAAQRLILHGLDERYLPLRARVMSWQALGEAEILEVGSGTGSIPSRGVATDLDAQRVAVVARGGRLAVVANGRTLPFSRHTFGLAYTEGVLHHLDDAGAVELVAEMLRVCRPDGRVVIMDSVWPRSIWRVPAWVIRRMDYGRHVRTEEHLRRVLGAAGGTLISAERFTYTTIGLECLLTVWRPSQ